MLVEESLLEYTLLESAPNLCQFVWRGKEGEKNWMLPALDYSTFPDNHLVWTLVGNNNLVVLDNDIISRRGWNFELKIISFEELQNFYNSPDQKTRYAQVQNQESQATNIDSLAKPTVDTVRFRAYLHQRKKERIPPPPMYRLVRGLNSESLSQINFDIVGNKNGDLWFFLQYSKKITSYRYDFQLGQWTEAGTYDWDNSGDFYSLSVNNRLYLVTEAGTLFSVEENALNPVRQSLPLKDGLLLKKFDEEKEELYFLPVTNWDSRKKTMYSDYSTDAIKLLD